MESFYTLQGEGFHQGRAAYFIRLGGCDVGCVWCDVKESWDASKHPQLPVEIIVTNALKGSGFSRDPVSHETGMEEPVPGGRGAVAQVQAQVKTIGQSMSGNGGKLRNSGRLPLVVVTGGEPLLHHLDELTRRLHLAGFEINIETSGSSPLSGEWDWVCLSPKKFKTPLPEIFPFVNELKVVVFNRFDFDWAELYAKQMPPGCKLYLQPEWDKAAEVTPLIIEYIKANPQWELSLQIHKYINVP